MLSREGLRAPPGPEGEKARLAAVVSGDHAAALLVPRRTRRGHMAGRHIAPIYVEGPLRLDRIRRVEVADGQRSRVGMLRRQVVETAARRALSAHGIPSLEGVHLAPGPRVVPMTSSMTSSWSPIP